MSCHSLEGSDCLPHPGRIDKEEEKKRKSSDSSTSSPESPPWRRERRRGEKGNDGGACPTCGGIAGIFIPIVPPCASHHRHEVKKKKKKKKWRQEDGKRRDRAADEKSRPFLCPTAKLRRTLVGWRGGESVFDCSRVTLSVGGGWGSQGWRPWLPKQPSNGGWRRVGRCASTRRRERQGHKRN